MSLRHCIACHSRKIPGCCNQNHCLIIRNHKSHHPISQVLSSKTTSFIIRNQKSHHPKPQVVSSKYHSSHHTVTTGLIIQNHRYYHPNTTGLIIQIPQVSSSKYHRVHYPNTTCLIIQIPQISSSKYYRSHYPNNTGLIIQYILLRRKCARFLLTFYCTVPGMGRQNFLFRIYHSSSYAAFPWVLIISCTASLASDKDMKRREPKGRMERS